MTPQTLTMRQAAQYLKDNHSIDLPPRYLREYLDRRMIRVTKVLGKLRITPAQLDKFATSYVPQGKGAAWRQYVTKDESRNWMTVDDVMKEMSVSRATVYTWASTRQWRKKKIGRLVLYLRADAMAPVTPRKPITVKGNQNFNVGIAPAKKSEKLRNRAAIADVVRRYQAGKVTAIVAERGVGVV